MRTYPPTRKVYQTWLAIFLLLVPASAGLAQATTAKLWAREVVNSAKLKEKRPIFIVTPEGYDIGNQRYPVLVVLDAEDRGQFLLAIANVAFLSSREEMPQTIVVGIPNGRDRIHDLTPPATGGTATESPTAGGAATFADFILDEVIPLVRSKYRTLPVNFLAGHSAGGLFGLEIAAKRPSSFAGILAMSPALWFNDSALVIPLADALAKAPKRPRLFVTSGALEDGIDRPTRRFSARLDSVTQASTWFGHRHYSDATHSVTPGSSFVDGLRFIFDPVSTAKLPISAWWDPGPDSTTLMTAWVESERRYSLGARSMGLPEMMPEGQLNSVAYRAISFNPAFAVSLFRENVARYPKSANPYDSLGDGLLAAGDTAAAMAQFTRAVSIGTRTGWQYVGVSQEKLRALKAAKSKR